jgi:predicted TIM-barrel fold metal-dependent hydrolase
MSTAGWDCHAHLFGPYDRFPLAANRSYTPAEAVASQYLALLARLSLTHGVVVNPSAYGTDHSLLFEALSVHKNLRGVVVTRPGALPVVASLRDKGVRGARFSHRSGGNFGGSATLGDLLALAPSLADAGLHAELWTDCQALPQIADKLSALPFPVVIDHMGGFDVATGIDDRGFRCLLELVEKGTAWVKLCAYRNLLAAPDIDAGKPFHDALLQANPGRLLWGSDWPHLRVTPVPQTEQLLDVFKRWTGDDAIISQVLTGNPTALYR